MHMIDIKELQPLIVDRLKQLEPQKIILFGSYAYGTPNDDSDIDLFLIKDDIKISETRIFEIKAHKLLKDIIKKYREAFDILSAPTSYIQQRNDYFYKVDILKNGKILYE